MGGRARKEGEAVRAEAPRVLGRIRAILGLISQGQQLEVLCASSRPAPCQRAALPSPVAWALLIWPGTTGRSWLMALAKEWAALAGSAGLFHVVTEYGWDRTEWVVLPAQLRAGQTGTGQGRRTPPSRGQALLWWGGLSHALPLCHACRCDYGRVWRGRGLAQDIRTRPTFLASPEQPGTQ